MGLKEKVHQYLEQTPTSPGPRTVQLGIMLIIVLNVAAVVVESVRVEVGGQTTPLVERYPEAFQAVEMFSIAVFTVEYLLRLWSSTAHERFSRPIVGRIRFALTPLALVDLMAILPAYFQATGFLAIRSLRLVRIFRIFKLGHYSAAVRSLNRALLSKRAELGVTVFVILILLVLVSTLMYHVEHQAQPDRFSSVPAAMWWGIVTLTTVGYGDISPITALGKLLGGVVSIFGIGLVALPAGLLGSAFIQELETSRSPPRCPHCGKALSRA